MGDFKANSKAKAKLPQGYPIRPFGHSTIVCPEQRPDQARPDRLNTVNGRDYQWANYNLDSNNMSWSQSHRLSPNYNNANQTMRIVPKQNDSPLWYSLNSDRFKTENV